VPDDVVVRAGLAAGMELDRPALRTLRRELRRAEALATAGRALARRDLSRAQVEERLERRAVPPAARSEAVEILERLGLVDDTRSARARAAGLAGRGWGDAAIAARLEEEGFESGAAAEALAGLEPERVRAAAVTGSHRDRRKAASALARRGFGEDAIEACVGPLDEWPPAGVP
jgi:regulatory protein